MLGFSKQTQQLTPTEVPQDDDEVVWVSVDLAVGLKK